MKTPLPTVIRMPLPRHAVGPAAYERALQAPYFQGRLTSAQVIARLQQAEALDAIERAARSRRVA